MSAVPKLQSQLVAEALRREDERGEPLDELRRARGERLFLAAATQQAQSPLTAAVDAPAARRTSKAIWIGGSLALAAGVLLALHFTSSEAPPSYAVHSGGDAASAGPVVAGTELALSAGETASVTLHDLSVSVSERSRLSVEALSIEDVRVALADGEARFAFHPRARGHQHVAIRTPSARVEIVGTELTIRVSERGTEVVVHEGVVRVIPTVGEAELVYAGSSLVVPVYVAARALEPVDAVASDAALGSGGDGAERVSPPEFSEGMVSGTSAAGVGGDVESPDTEPIESPIADSSDAPSDRVLLARAESLLDREDDARAEVILEQLVAGAARRADRVHAAMMVGDLRQSSGDYRGALRAYDQAFALARGAHRAHALYEHGRILDRELHELAAARADYVRYLTEFPDGPNADQTHRRLCELGGADGIACD